MPLLRFIRLYHKNGRNGKASRKLQSHRDVRFLANLTCRRYRNPTSLAEELIFTCLLSFYFKLKSIKLIKQLRSNIVINYKERSPTWLHSIPSFSIFHETLFLFINLKTPKITFVIISYGSKIYKRVTYSRTTEIFFPYSWLSK